MKCDSTRDWGEIGGRLGGDWWEIGGRLGEEMACLALFFVSLVMSTTFRVKSNSSIPIDSPILICSACPYKSAISLKGSVVSHVGRV